MTDYRYPLSPPTSTSLPEHWHFAPPATDGPNTRARLAEGLHPHSGAAPPRQRTPWSQEATQQVWTPSEPAQGWPTAPEQQWAFSVPAGHGEYALDPLLQDAAAASSSTWHRDNNTDTYRNFSTATFIDHGSPPRSSTEPTRVETQTIELAPGQSVGSLGLTKEEWLRLGGFGPEAEDAVPPRVEATREIEAASGATAIATESAVHSMALPPPIWTADGDHFVLPDPPADLSDASPALFHETPHNFLSADISTQPAVPAAPPPRAPSAQLQERDPNSNPDDEAFRWPEPISRTPARSQRRRAPSPIQAHRTRPAPYPTSSTQAEILVDAPELTPVRAALARYPEIPMPAVPPSPIAPPPGKKKSHGRKMSADHIPRPRNAFILFRSHAITSGLIPRSIGVKDHKNISQIVGGVWRGLSAPERQQWEQLAEEEKRRHLAKYPDYAYRPKQKDGPRATPGQGKKARAKAARLAADYGSLLHEHQRDDNDDDDQGDADDGAARHARSTTHTSSTSSTSSTRAASAIPSAPADPAKLARHREERQMALIAQAVLEGEEDEHLMERVDEQLERELGPTPPSSASAGTRPKRKGDLPVVAGSSSRRKKGSSEQISGRPSPSKKPRNAPITPRKTRSKAQASEQRSEDETPPKRSLSSSYVSPTSSDSTVSPSPFRRMAYQANGRPVSPASSHSPSPVRMHQPAYHLSGPKRAGSYGQHPLSRSRSAPDDEQANDVPVTLRGKKGTYVAAGLGVHDPMRPAYGLPSPSLSDQAGTSPYTFPPTEVADVPLFSGPTDSRQFSLGKWEIRKPSTAVTSRRELLAQQVEEAEEWRAEQDGRPMRATPGTLSFGAASYAPTPPGLSFDPSAFLVDVGVSTGQSSSRTPNRSAALDRDDASTEYGTAYSSSLFDEWQSETASSIYESAPSSSAHSAAARMAMPASMAKKFPQGLFRQPSSGLSVAAGPSLFAAQQQQHAMQTTAADCEPISATATAGASPEEQLFHFGAEDLFAQPPASFSLFAPATHTASEWPSGLATVSDGRSAADYSGLGISVNPLDTHWQ